MKNADYEIIIKNITDQIDECEKALSLYNASSCNFNKMQVEHLNATIASCRKMHGKMDRFVTSDLYHIVGMAGLNAAQMSKVIKLTKTLLKYRTDVKFFAGQNTITVPKRNPSCYKLSAGIELIK